MPDWGVSGVVSAELESLDPRKITGFPSLSTKPVGSIIHGLCR